MAYTEYQLSLGTIVLMHTEVPNELRGKGIGSKLARGHTGVRPGTGPRGYAGLSFYRRLHT